MNDESSNHAWQPGTAFLCFFACSLHHLRLKQLFECKGSFGVGSNRGISVWCLDLPDAKTELYQASVHVRCWHTTVLPSMARMCSNSESLGQSPGADMPVLVHCHWMAGPSRGIVFLEYFTVGVYKRVGLHIHGPAGEATLPWPQRPTPQFVSQQEA